VSEESVGLVEGRSEYTFDGNGKPHWVGTIGSQSCPPSSAIPAGVPPPEPPEPPVAIPPGSPDVVLPPELLVQPKRQANPRMNARRSIARDVYRHTLSRKPVVRSLP